MRLLCTGDIHIGRRSSRLHYPGDASRFSAAGAWERIVQLAIDESADLVLLAGDVVDRANKYFEAVGALERGVRRLFASGIEVYAVAGNHDHDVLPRLAGRLEGFTILGMGGKWQRVPVEREGRVRLYLDGWSFPSEHVLSNPLASREPSWPEDAPLVGVLHADLNPASPYAPVSADDIRRAGGTAWVLGHIHRPGRLMDAPFAFYAGCPHALDPGETGPHGAWLLDVSGTGQVEARIAPLSSVRYEDVEIDLALAKPEDDLAGIVAFRLRDDLARWTEESGGQLEAVSCRLRLTGRTRLHREAAEAADGIVQDLELREKDARLRVERVDCLTRPAMDIQALEGSAGPAGELARVIASLESGPLDGECAALVGDIREAMERERTKKPFNRIDWKPVSEEDVRAVALEESWRLLDALQSQKEARP